MDPFSHVAFGRTLAALPIPRARSRGTIVAVVLGALAPDVDAVLMPFGWDVYLRAHEIGTHSLLGSLAIAALTALAVRLSIRGSRYSPLVPAAWAGSLSHLALDILSGAQVGVGWPLTDSRMSLPLVAMAEPVLIAIFFTGSVALIAVRTSPAPRQRLTAIGVLTVAFLFLGLKAVLLLEAMASLGRPVRTGTQPGCGSALGEPDGVVRLRSDGGRAPATAGASRRRPGAAAVVADRRGLSPRHAARVHWPPCAIFSGFMSSGSRCSCPIPLAARTCSGRTSDSAGRQPTAPQRHRCSPRFTPSGGGTGIACGLWFGGTFDDDGRVVRQRVQVGGWSQTRAP